MKTFATPTWKRAKPRRPPAPRITRTPEADRVAQRAEIRHILYGPRLQRDANDDQKRFDDYLETAKSTADGWRIKARDWFEELYKVDLKKKNFRKSGTRDKLKQMEGHLNLRKYLENNYDPTIAGRFDTTEQLDESRGTARTQVKLIWDHYRQADFDAVEIDYDPGCISEGGTDMLGSSWPGSKQFALTDCWLSMEPGIRANVALHELMHAMHREMKAGADVYCFKDDYPGDDPTNNAAAHANFAQELSGSWQCVSGISDEVLREQIEQIIEHGREQRRR